MANVRNNASAQLTRHNLLEAAGYVFAERGLHSATIKEITDRAGASLAAVNYHFKDKTELYVAVIRTIVCDAQAIIPPADESPTSPAESLRKAICHLVRTMLGRQRAPWERVLMARELSQPTRAIDELVESVARPLHDRLGRLIADLTGLRKNDRRVALCASSIVAQCLYYIDHRAAMERLYPKWSIDNDIEAIASHIAAFSIAGVKARKVG